jgi:hypothetical protein
MNCATFLAGFVNTSTLRVFARGEGDDVLEARDVPIATVADSDWSLLFQTARTFSVAYRKRRRPSRDRHRGGLPRVLRVERGPERTSMSCRSITSLWDDEAGTSSATAGKVS